MKLLHKKLINGEGPNWEYPKRIRQQMMSKTMTTIQWTDSWSSKGRKKQGKQGALT
jgi:hypothetical protein